VGAKSASAKKKPSTPALAVPPPPPRERERWFLVAKKGARRRHNLGSVGGVGNGEIDFDKCPKAARKAGRAGGGVEAGGKGRVGPTDMGWGRVSFIEGMARAF
jgi:hypothetical protein